MTVQQLRTIFDEVLSKTVIVFDSYTKPFQLYCSAANFWHLWYCCTSEQDDFKIVSGKLYYKGFEVVGRG